MSPFQLDQVGASSRPADGSVAAGDTILVPDAVRLSDRANRAATFLKALSHEGRLMILCHLANGELSVGELEKLLDMRQAAVSQQLSRLRLEGLVATRRDGKTIYYSILDPKVKSTVILMHRLFCEEE